MALNVPRGWIFTQDEHLYGPHVYYSLRTQINGREFRVSYRLSRKEAWENPAIVEEEFKAAKVQIERWLTHEGLAGSELFSHGPHDEVHTNSW